MAKKIESASLVARAKYLVDPNWVAVFYNGCSKNDIRRDKQNF